MSFMNEQENKETQADTKELGITTIMVYIQVEEIGIKQLNIMKKQLKVVMLAL